MAEEYTLESVRATAVGKELPLEELERFHAGYEDVRMIPTREEDARVYYFAPGTEGPYPVVINLHGGGFVKGRRDQDTVFCRNLVENAGVCVVDIDYHTAPEKMYPYALNECYDVAKYVAQHPEEFHADPTKIVLMGHSAGANLVFGLQFLALEEGIFQPALLVSEYPPLDFTQDPEDARYAHAPFTRIPPEKARKYNGWYVDKKYIREITASPIFASKSELAGFAPVLLILAELDTLTPNAVRFAAKLIDAGVTVTAKTVKGANHGFTIQRRPGFDVAEALIFDALNKIKQQ